MGMKYIEILELARDAALENWYRWFEAYQTYPNPTTKAKTNEWNEKMTELNLMIYREQN